jgi:hypothetical protein
MRYEAIYRFYPPSAFGVPEDDTFVFPEPKGGGTVHWQTDHRLLPGQDHVGWGTLSEYRQDGERFQKEFDAGGLHFQITDNYATVTFEAEATEHPGLKCRPVMIALTRRLTLLTGKRFQYRRIQLKCEEGTIIPYAPAAQSKMTLYSIPKVVRGFDEALTMMQTTDPVFEKAILYFDHATLISENMFRWTEWNRDNMPLMVADALLNYWKAITCVLGDWSKGEDLRANCKALGFPDDFYANKIDPIKEARNNYDLAHYDLDPRRVEKAVVENLVTDIRQTTSAVTGAYLKHLRAGGKPLKAPPLLKQNGEE